MELARPAVGCSSGSTPEPGATSKQNAETESVVLDRIAPQSVVETSEGKTEESQSLSGGTNPFSQSVDGSADVLRSEPGVSASPNSVDSVDCVTCNHLWMRNEWFIVYGTCLTGAEATELPWRRRKDHELATQNEIRRDLELVQSLYVRGTNQGPSAFDEVKLYLREDIG